MAIDAYGCVYNFRMATISGRWSLGIFFILLVALLWTGGSILTQFIYSNLNFRSPFLLTYISSSLFLLYLPIWKILTLFGYTESPVWDEDDENESSPSVLPLLNDKLEGGISSTDERALKSHQQTIRIALYLVPLWFFANCCYSYSLLYTTISSSTIISNLSGPFTLFFSYLAGVEDVTAAKLLGVCFCFAGAVLVGFQDQGDSDDDGNSSTSMSLIGDILALCGAVGYGLYTTYIKVNIKFDDSVSMELLLGYMGLINSLAVLPFALLVAFLHLDNVSNFSGTVFGYLFLGGIVDYVLSDYLWARAVVLTTPTVATVGLSTTIPMAFVADMLLNSAKIGLFSVLGSICVIIGFLVLNVGEGPKSDSERSAPAAEDI